MFNIVKIDSKNRITIPQHIKKAMGLERGALLAITLDPAAKGILLTPIAPRPDAVHELDLVLDSAITPLATFYGALDSNNVDVIYSRCANMVGKRYSACTLLVDITRTTRSWEEIVGDLRRLSGVVSLEARKTKPGA